VACVRACGHRVSRLWCRRGGIGSVGCGVGEGSTGGKEPACKERIKSEKGRKRRGRMGRRGRDETEPLTRRRVSRPRGTGSVGDSVGEGGSDETDHETDDAAQVPCLVRLATFSYADAPSRGSRRSLSGFSCAHRAHDACHTHSSLPSLHYRLLTLCSAAY